MLHSVLTVILDSKRIPDTKTLREIQLQKLNRTLAAAMQRPFYAERLNGLTLPLRSLDQLDQLPLLSKDELIPANQNAPARIFDLPTNDYVRAHQTSGSKGWPLPVYDTPQDWQWWLECWQYVLDQADATDHDIAMMAFSFGPFIGFWTANDALVKRGTLVLPGGGMSSETRLKMILDRKCTIVCCTPTYALHLANVAAAAGWDLAESHVRVVIVAGEPGGSVPVVRQNIEQAWGARVVDHAGASEVGAWGYGDREGRGLHVIETEFIAEIVSVDSAGNASQVPDGEPGELLLTNLGRLGGPAIRYRTGDVVRGRRDGAGDGGFLWLDGGVLGRADDMLIVRGVNIFPSSVDAIIREVDASVEYRVTVNRMNQMDQLSIEMESDETVQGKIERLLRERLAMRVDVRTVPSGTLPRFEAKSKRWTDQRE